MAVTLTGTKGLFTRLGKLGKSYLRVVSGYGSTLNDEVIAIDGQYEDGTDAVAVDSLYTTRDGYRGVHGTYLSALGTISTNTVIEQVNRDTPLAAKTLANALDTLFTQMESSSSTVQRPTTSITITADSGNLGDSVVVGSLTNEYGDPLDLVFDETVNLKCTADSATGATQYQETLTIAGEPAKAVTDYEWPGGSGATGTINLFDASVDDLVQNGDFADWAGSPLSPTGWTIGTGVAGTSVVRATDVVRSGGTYSMSFVSDGSVLQDVYQTVSIRPNTVYCFSAFCKISSTDSTGTFRVRLTNGSNTTLTNDATTSLSFTKGVNGGSGIGSSYGHVYGFFQTPRQLPSTVRLHIEMTVSPTSGRILYINLASLKAARQLYAGGPFIAGWSKGATNPTAKGDKYSVVVANDANPVSFSKHLDRIFSLRSLGLYPPSAASTPTVADSLLQ